VLSTGLKSRLELANDQENGEIVRIGLPNRLRAGVNVGNTLPNVRVEA